MTTYAKTPQSCTDAPSYHPRLDADAVADLRRRCEGFRPRVPDPHLTRGLAHGWMLPALLTLDACLWNRWDYWLTCHESLSQPESTLPTARIPRLDFLGLPHAATRKMLETSLNSVPAHGTWQSWGGWQYFDYLLSWLLFGFGHQGQPELPPEPIGCAGASNRLYQVFCLDAVLLWPYDYLGDLLADNAYGKRQGFYPTPHTLCEAMARMLMSKEKNHRRETVCDPCGGTGRMVLHASNYCLRPYGMDIDAVLCKATLVNGYLYAPWLVKPLPHLSPELNMIGEGHADATLEDDLTTKGVVPSMNVAAALSDSMAESAPPHTQSYLADTEHDALGQRAVAPLLKRRKRSVDPTQGNLFELP